jgi:Lon protease-like protein
VRLEEVVKKWPSLRYQLYFIQNDWAEKEFNNNMTKFFKTVFRTAQKDDEIENRHKSYPLQDGETYLGAFSNVPLSKMIEQRVLDDENAYAGTGLLHCRV